MDLVVVDETVKHRLPFYLAQEEYLARNYSDREFFFMWQVDPTVIVGRHQLIDKEVDIEFCKNNNIDVIRRKSGGGAVLADLNNIMFSYITSSDDVVTTFSTYTSKIANSLKLLGLPASDNSRNDILIGDKKVSGNSFYHIPGRSIVHGTMLYDFNADLMSKALSPSKEKLESHGVASTRSRVTSIKENIPDITIGDFKRHIVNTIIDGESIVLHTTEIAEIKKIEKSYYNDEWIYGKNPKGEINASKRFEGIGEIGISLQLSHGKISDISITGDFIDTIDAGKYLNSHLKGVNYNRMEVAKILECHPLSNSIPLVSNNDFINLIF